MGILINIFHNMVFMFKWIISLFLFSGLLLREPPWHWQCPEHQMLLLPLEISHRLIIMLEYKSSRSTVMYVFNDCNNLYRNFIVGRIQDVSNIEYITARHNCPFARCHGPSWNLFYQHISDRSSGVRYIYCGLKLLDSCIYN